MAKLLRVWQCAYTMYRTCDSFTEIIHTWIPLVFRTHWITTMVVLFLLDGGRGRKTASRPLVLFCRNNQQGCLMNSPNRAMAVVASGLKIQGQRGNFPRRNQNQVDWWFGRQFHRVSESSTQALFGHKHFSQLIIAISTLWSGRRKVGQISIISQNSTLLIGAMWRILLLDLATVYFCCVLFIAKAVLTQNACQFWTTPHPHDAAAPSNSAIHVQSASQLLLRWATSGVSFHQWLCFRH